MKKEIIPEFLWHLGQVVFTFQTTIITTVDAQGRINAAPYGLVYPFSTGIGTPQMLAGINSEWHTAQNILATGEFVINYPGSKLMEQVVQTGLMFPEGVNELEEVGLAVLPSVKVRPPRVKDCFQHIECRLASVLRPNEAQINFIGDILSISLDVELLALQLPERVRAADPLMFLGIDIMTFTGTYGRLDGLCEYTPPTVDLVEKNE